MQRSQPIKDAAASSEAASVEFESDEDEDAMK